MEAKIESQINDCRRLKRCIQQLGEWTYRRSIIRRYNYHPHIDELDLDEWIEEKPSTIDEPVGLKGIFAKRLIPKCGNLKHIIYTLWHCTLQLALTHT